MLREQAVLIRANLDDAKRKRDAAALVAGDRLNGLADAVMRAQLKPLAEIGGHVQTARRELDALGDRLAELAALDRTIANLEEQLP